MKPAFGDSIFQNIIEDENRVVVARETASVLVVGSNPLIGISQL